MFNENNHLDIGIALFSFYRKERN